MRWQLAQEASFTTFWQGVFRNHTALLYLPPSRADGGQDLVAIQELETAAPLINLAGEFHRQLTPISTLTPNIAINDMLFSVGTAAEEQRAASPAPPTFLGDNGRFVMRDTSVGREIFDRRTPVHQGQKFGRAALLTIVTGPHHWIRVDGTDDAAIRTLVATLCDESTFPLSLADSMREDTLTQVVFPMAPHSEATVFHMPLRTVANNADSLP